MRVSTSFIHMQGVQNILDMQSRVIRAQDQLAQGKKNLVPSDDPGAAARVMDINVALAQITQFDENGNYATQRLNLEETSIESSINVLQRVRELAIQAGNTGTNDLQAQKAIAAEIKEKLKELLDYANTKDATGDYLFSGFQSKILPFTTDALGNYFYNGDQGQLALQIGSSRQVAANDSGADVFQLIRTGNGDFLTDVNRTNAGTGRITTGSIIDRAAFQAHDYTIRFIDANNFEVINNTTATTLLPTPRPYTDGNVITFAGMSMEISNAPAAGDEFTVNASRHQDVFTSINNLIRELNTPGVGDVIGNFGGAYLANGFAAGDAMSFDLTFDGQAITINAVAGATDAATAASITAGLVAAGVTDNLDGTYTLNGNTPGISITFQINPTTNAIEFRTDGANGQLFSNLNISNLADTGNDGVLLLNALGNTVASFASITSAVVGDAAFFGPGAHATSFLSQQIDIALNHLDRAMNKMIDVQTSIGGRINSIESQAVDNEAKKVNLQGVRSNIEDLDFAEAISRLTFQTTALQIAQQTFVRIQNLNLFEFL